MRGDTDSWDINTSVGATALLVAGARALEARRPAPLAVDRYAELFCRAAGGSWAELLDDKVPGHRLNSEFGATLQMLIGLRTRYFDNYVRGAADAGVRQVVILAAGLDSRAYRLVWPDDTVIFEVDQPGVLEFKRAVLAEHGTAATAQRREIAVDLRADWPAALREHGFDSTRPSAWLVEGLLMYLRAADRERLFTGIDALASAASHIGMEDVAQVDPADFEAARERERATGAELFTLFYNEHRAAAGQWLRARGWDTVSTPALDYARALALCPPDPSSEGGLVVGSVSLVSGTKTIPRERR